MATPPQAGDRSLERYSALSSQARAAMLAGNLKGAEALLADCLHLAQSKHLQHVRDRAYCNWVGARLKLHHDSRVKDRLGEILGASPDTKARQLAAYQLGDFYGPLNKRLSQYYAEVSYRLALTAGEEMSIIASAHLVGSQLVGRGCYEAARPWLETALAANHRRPEAGAHDLLTGTIAYCQALAGDRPGAQRILDQMTATDGGMPPIYQLESILARGFTYLELAEPEPAAQCARVVLEAARAIGGEPGLRAQKHGLYLQGEVAVQLGNRRAARESYSLLQALFYPDFPELPDFLLGADTHSLVNFLA